MSRPVGFIVCIMNTGTRRLASFVKQRMKPPRRSLAKRMRPDGNTQGSKSFVFPNVSCAILPVAMSSRNIFHVVDSSQIQRCIFGAACVK